MLEHLLPGELAAAGSPVVVVALVVGWGRSLPGTYVGAGCRGSWVLLVARWWWRPWWWVGVGLFQGHMLEHLLPGELGAAGSPVVVVGWGRSLPGTYVGAGCRGSWVLLVARWWWWPWGWVGVGLFQGHMLELVAEGVGCCW